MPELTSNGQDDNRGEDRSPDVERLEAPAESLALSPAARFPLTDSQPVDDPGAAGASAPPVEARQAYAGALGTLDADQNGVPDILEGAQARASFSTQPQSAAAQRLPAAPAAHSPRQRLWTLLLVLLSVAVLGALLFYLWQAQLPR